MRAYIEYSDPKELRTRGCGSARVDIPIGLRNFELNLLRCLNHGYDCRVFTDFYRASQTVYLNSQESPNKGFSYDFQN